MSYEARMEGAKQTITADSLADAIEQAADWACDGNWDVEAGTVWVHAYLIELDEDGEEIDSHRIKVQIDPDEPDCTESEHDWQAPLAIVGGTKENPGVWGHGLTIQEVCVRCGCGKLTDTWAQDPETGEQGLRSVAYQPGKYTAEIQRQRDAEVRDFVAAYDDDDDIPADELERVFALAYGRAADDEDRETGMWSLICASVTEA